MCPGARLGHIGRGGAWNSAVMPEERQVPFNIRQESGKSREYRTFTDGGGPSSALSQLVPPDRAVGT